MGLQVDFGGKFFANLNDSQANIFQLVGYNHPNLAYIQSFWSQLTGTESKMELVDGLRNEIIATANIGWEVWSSFILKEEINIISHQVSPKGNYPMEKFHSSGDISIGFFTNKQSIIHD
ncbi:hypothetical protein VP01_571g7 [Puccinia sorghi]|uniref:Uncharacterized protein n=1 Tax=Puccinia sorghi TaxID=27349 RepID=A0A0L6UIK8_9BASI|nr:hypothetical protein VP01_571g7 [Puccinia sorghi]